MAKHVLKNLVLEYIQSVEGGVTVRQLQEVFNESSHKIGGALLRLRNDGKVRKVEGNKRDVPTTWYAISNFRMARE